MQYVHAVVENYSPSPDEHANHDYDALRKEVAATFVDRAAEVQSLVAKLQKTQRAAEQVLNKHGFSFLHP